MENEPDCKCIKILGHLDAVKWIISPRGHKPSSGPLALGDWKQNPHIWLYYVESSDGLLLEDDVLRSTDSRYWSIHDVQRYFLGELHCEKVLFTYQYPSLKLPSQLATYLWKANASLKLPPKLYMKELHMSIEHTLKKMEMKQVQMIRLLISDQLIKINCLDYFKRIFFFRTLHNIISAKKEMKAGSIIPTVTDPKRPWRNHSSKEKLLRIDIELKQHMEKSGIAISPVEDDVMKLLIRECREETQIAPRVCADRLKDTVDEARRSLPNFQYRSIENSTATAILLEAHGSITPKYPVQYTE